MQNKKLYFAIYFPEPRPRIVVAVRDAELVGNVYRFDLVACLRSRISVDEVGTLLENDIAVADDEEKALALLRDNFIQRARKLERKAARLRSVGEMYAEHEKA